MGRAVLLVALVVAVAAAPTATTAPAAVETRSCMPAGAFFNVHVAGHKQAGYWLGVQHEMFGPVPAQKALVAVWSFGSEATKRPVLYAWSAGGRSTIRASCRELGSMPAPARGELRAPFRVKSGWSIGKRYECSRGGRVAIRTETIARGMRMTVWAERSRRLLAVAELTAGGGWLRASKSCVERRY
jgi:hypothetical protein